MDQHVFLELVPLVSGMAAGTLITWFIMYVLGRRDREGAAQIEPMRKQLEETRQENIRLKARMESDQEKLQWMEKARHELADTFAALSSKALRDNSSQIINQSRESIFRPLDRELQKLEKQVQALESKREGAYRSIETHVVNLQKAFGEMQSTTHSLASALKSSSVRGTWGEVQLRRIAELAGMVDHVDFEEQKSADRGSSRPDMIVYLPGGGIIPVDAKAPMSAYLEAFESRDEQVRRNGLTAHANSIRKHMRDLSGRAYWDQFENAPEFVAMMIPYESGLSAAFTVDPKLYDEALSSRVIIVSPATLLALLKAVSAGWLQLRLEENARSIAELGKELLDRFNTFNDHFGKIGKSLDGAVESYNAATGSMQSRVIPTLRRMKELGTGGEEPVENQPLDSRARELSSSS